MVCYFWELSSAASSSRESDPEVSKLSYSYGELSPWILLKEQGEAGPSPYPKIYCSSTTLWNCAGPDWKMMVVVSGALQWEREEPEEYRDQMSWCNVAVVVARALSGTVPHYPVSSTPTFKSPIQPPLTRSRPLISTESNATQDAGQTQAPELSVKLRQRRFPVTIPRCPAPGCAGYLPPALRKPVQGDPSILQSSTLNRRSHH